MHISSITASFSQDIYRVCADVDGEPLWFESADVGLLSSPEAFASAMLIPALARGERLTLEEPVSSIWRSNVRRALPTFNKWWGYPELLPEPFRHPPQTRRAAGTALCFTGGVDSFYSLLRSGHTINYLVFAWGFDIPLLDRARFEAFEASLREVAAETGARGVVVRTNLRQHPSFTPVSWERTHGGALAAIGHLLSEVAGQLLISSSRKRDDPTPWGSHWMTDEFWSSERLTVIHVGAELKRFEKLPLIAAEPLVRRRLRVCWENRAPSGNCSRCDKCVRTRLALLGCGELANFPVFEGEESLVQHIDDLPPSRSQLLTHRRLVNQDNISPEIKQALLRLIERSDRAKRREESAWRKFLRRIRPNGW